MAWPKGKPHPRPEGWVNPRKGVPTGKKRPLEERFWEKVDRNGPEHSNLGKCWVWTGSINARGYGQLFSHYRRGIPYSDVTHRISYRLHRGEIPEGLFIDHMCMNKACVNPDHLRAVTPKVNSVENNTNPFARNAQKTHCKYGHEFTPENTRWVEVPFYYGRKKIRTEEKRKTRVCIACYNRRLEESKAA